MPVRMRAASSASTSCSGMGRAPPAGPQPRGAAPFVSGTTSSSCSVFHLRQAGHWPSHLGLDWPHSVQAKTVLCLAAMRVTATKG